MAYIQIEANVRTHRKFLKAGPAASWLWVCGLGYCQEGLTDGHIPTSALAFLGVPAAKAQKLADRLVDCHLWEKVRDGWQIHHYLDHNRSAEQIRATMRKRAAAGILGGRPKVNHVGSPVQTNEVNHPENPILPSVRPTDLPTEDQELRKDQNLPAQTPAESAR